MADQTQLPPLNNPSPAPQRPLSPAPLRPMQSASPMPPVTTPPPRPITPPAGIPVQETDLSHLSPSPAPHLPPSQPLPTPKPTFTPPPAPRPVPSTVSGIPPVKTPLATPTPQPQQPAERTVPPSPTFRSSIRTMEQDLNRVPSTSTTTSVSKTLPTATVPAPQAPNRISIPPPPSPRIPTATKSAPTAVDLPPRNSGGHKMVWFIVGILVIAMAVVAYFLFWNSSEETTPTPTPTASRTPVPTPTPSGFDEVFHPNMDQTLTADESSINAQMLGIGEMKVFSSFLSASPFPAELSAALDSGKIYLTLFGKPDGSKGRGYMFKITDSNAIEKSLVAWEPTMARDMKNLLMLNTQRSASADFLSNSYQNTPIKYRNFPDAFNSLDYSIITLPNGDRYLVFTNTRDHMFAIIDRTMGAVLGK